MVLLLGTPTEQQNKQRRRHPSNTRRTANGASFYIHKTAKYTRQLTASGNHLREGFFYGRQGGECRRTVHFIVSADVGQVLVLCKNNVDISTYSKPE